VGGGGGERKGCRQAGGDKEAGDTGQGGPLRKAQSQVGCQHVKEAGSSAVVAGSYQHVRTASQADNLV
jgi:hypothetical protein